MELTELKSKAEGIIQGLALRLGELEKQEQAIKAEICRYQGEVRAYNKMMEPKDDKEEDRPAKNAERVEKIEP